MSGRNGEDALAGAARHLRVQGREWELSLSPDALVFHRGGLEFRSAAPFSTWGEVTLTLQSPGGADPIEGSGVVISCTGNRHTGYHVSMVLTGLSHGASDWLGVMSAAQLD